jgi:hypothetical protein
MKKERWYQVPRTTSYTKSQLITIPIKINLLRIQENDNEPYNQIKCTYFSIKTKGTKEKNSIPLAAIHLC